MHVCVCRFPNCFLIGSIKTAEANHSINIEAGFPGPRRKRRRQREGQLLSGLVSQLEEWQPSQGSTGWQHGSGCF